MQQAHQFIMRCTNRVNTETAPDHLTVQFTPTAQDIGGGFQLVIPVADFDKFRPGQLYSFTVDEVPQPAVQIAEEVTE